MDHLLYSVRADLERSGTSREEIDDLMDRIRLNIEAKTREAIQDAVNEAVSIGESIGVDDFLEQIRLTAAGAGVSISTDSGATNFSTPPFPMLNNLLKRGKFSRRTGDTYKVIPVGKPSDKPAKMLKNVESGLNALNKLKGKTLEDMANSAITAFNAAADNRTAKPDTRASGPVVFRTASSKQDPNTAWVIPARSADMTAALVDINARLHFRLSSLVQEVLSEMEEEIDALRNV